MAYICVQCIGVRYLRYTVLGGIKPVSHRMHITCRFAWVLYKLSKKMSKIVACT